MFKRHPVGLRVLFFTEMWERFGFYTMLAVFVLYIKENWGWDDATAGSVYGTFLAAVYFTPIIGGWITDYVLGFRRTITIGAIVFAIGYAMLAIPTENELLLYASLAVIAIGNGLFKANISALVGNLYGKEQGGLKDAGFNIFYMGINIGAFFAPLGASWIKNLLMDSFGSSLAVGYNAAFGLAAFGMVLSVIIFTVFRRHYAYADKTGAEAARLEAEAEEITPEETRDRILALSTIFGIVIFFWMAFHQNGFTLTLFAKNYVQPWLDPEQYQVFNPLFIVILTPVIIGFFGWLAKQGREPSSPAKIGIGMILCGLAFSVLMIPSFGLPATSDGQVPSTALVSPAWLVSTYFVITISELFLSPMGLSFVSKVAPAKLKGVMMGGWFVSTAIGNYLSGFVGRFYQSWELWQFFLLLIVCSFLSALLVFTFLKKINRATRSKAPKERTADIELDTA